MAQQTLPRSAQQTPSQAQASARAPRPTQAPVSHRKPRPRRAGGSDTGGVRRQMAVVPLLVMFVLAWLAGALLAVHGPSESAPGGARPPLTLAPQTPSGPGAAEAEPMPPARKPAQPEEVGKPARPVAGGKVTLRPGDSLYALARRYGTAVKALQRVNNLGTSTLIYAGDTLRLPPVADDTDSESTGGHTSRPAPDTTHTPGKPIPAVKGRAAKAISFAKAQLGKPYVWGGTGSRGFDCSGLVMRAWKTAGVTLPRTTWGQIRAGEATTRARLVPGDLVISHGGGHVALYLGDGKVIHAPRPGRTVTAAPLADPSGVVSYRHITSD
ncbi:cell wall-associated NlpC family hydrolase [Streptomyces sp. SLBN-118]|uniref:C40 family peptidase n=1 Tax=Streptomyces sp. SLBN-118 TaxID=2768454 RepID=UPI00116C8B41|nr:C40 family peptidase [Streptomyces sp. SLBN-118]TQK45353.1 cell wall-associated NlpC family hydrolase [Streptomyces sp. SLBN-118]